METRVDKAVENFKKGYNCCQSVFMTYADLFGIDQETALKMTSTMGGGMGRMREVCGTVTAMSLLAGLSHGTISTQLDEREKIYALTRVCAERFKEQNQTIICRDLLGILGAEKSARPSERTPEYYKVRPCVRFVECAARIIEQELL